MKILILNGPNLSRLDLREQKHYGQMDYPQLKAAIEQKASELLYTGRRVNGTEAYELGLIDRVVPTSEIESAAFTLAAEIASSAPLAVESIRATLRKGIAEKVAQATQHEMAEQTRLKATADFAEGTKAVSQRRPAEFQRK